MVTAYHNLTHPQLGKPKRKPSST